MLCCIKKNYVCRCLWVWPTRSGSNAGCLNILTCFIAIWLVKGGSKHSKSTTQRALILHKLSPIPELPAVVSLLLRICLLTWED